MSPAGPRSRPGSIIRFRSALAAALVSMTGIAGTARAGSGCRAPISTARASAPALCRGRVVAITGGRANGSASPAGMAARAMAAGTAPACPANARQRAPATPARAPGVLTALARAPGVLIALARVPGVLTTRLLTMVARRVGNLIGRAGRALMAAPGNGKAAPVVPARRQASPVMASPTMPSRRQGAARRASRGRAIIVPLLGPLTVRLRQRSAAAAMAVQLHQRRAERTMVEVIARRRTGIPRPHRREPSHRPRVPRHQRAKTNMNNPIERQIPAIITQEAPSTPQ